MNNTEKQSKTPFSNFRHMIHGADYNPDQWMNHPEIIDQDIEYMKKAGINSVSIGIFAWSMLEPKEGQYQFEWLDNIMDKMAANGIKVILATPSGARPAWMDHDHPEVLRVSENRVRNLHGKRHNHCYTSPYYRKKVTEMNSLLAERYKDHKALAMWHVSNEYGGECHCELCQEAFRNWLKEKYHNDINELNEQWWAYFWSHKYNSFDEIESPSLHGEFEVHGMNLDWKRFVSVQTTDFYLTESAPLRQITPDIPITTNLQGTYPGLDPWEIAKHMDYISWDNYPKWHNPSEKLWETASQVSFLHDINRALGHGRSFLMMESTPSQVNWHDVNKLKKPGMHILSSLQAVAHGSDSVQYFQWRKSRGASEKLHGAVVDHCGRSDTRVFKEVSELGSILGRLDQVVGTTAKPQVGLIYDWENCWAIDDLQGLNKERDYQKVCMEHYQSFWKQGITVDVINMDCDFSQYKILVAPMLYMVRTGVADRLKQFVSNGGTLIFTYCTGWVNENDLCYLGGFPGDGLQEVAGVWAEECDPLYPEERNHCIVADSAHKSFELRSLCERIHALGECKVLATYGDDFYQGEPVVTENNYGTGSCYYIASRPEQRFLDEFYTRVCTLAGVEQSIPGILPVGVTVQKRTDGENTFYFILNFSEEEAVVKLPDDLSFTDEIEGAKATGAITLGKYGYRVLRVHA